MFGRLILFTYRLMNVAYSDFDILLFSHHVIRKYADMVTEMVYGPLT